MLCCCLNCDLRSKSTQWERTLKSKIYRSLYGRLMKLKTFPQINRSYFPVRVARIKTLCSLKKTSQLLHPHILALPEGVGKIISEFVCLCLIKQKKLYKSQFLPCLLISTEDGYSLFFYSILNTWRRLCY